MNTDTENVTPTANIATPSASAYGSLHIATPLIDPTQYVKYQRFMVFDVETTGLIPRRKYNDPLPPLDTLPHILQISCVIYETTSWSVIKTINLYIRVAEDVVIEPMITNLTGITRQICDEQGTSIDVAMNAFYQEFMQCNCVVAHNIEFDQEMIQIEMRRLSADPDFVEKCPLWGSVFDADFMKQRKIDKFCTMKVGRNICKIECTNDRGTYLKSPKLSELYEHLFGKGTVPPNLHNSLMDTFVCLRCFVKMRFKFDMPLSKFPQNMNIVEENHSQPIATMHC